MHWRWTCRRYCKNELLRSVPPNVQLSCEPWGHLNHADIDCVCLSSDRMGVYVHKLAPEAPSIGRDLPALTRRPGSVPWTFISHRAGAYGRLLLATYVRWQTGLLTTCDFLLQSSLSPIHSGDSVGRLSSSSSEASDDSNGDVGLQTWLLGFSSFGSMPRVSVSSDFSHFCLSFLVRMSGLSDGGCGFCKCYPQVFIFRSTIREVWAAATPSPGF